MIQADSLSLDMLPAVAHVPPRLPWSWVGRLEQPIALGLASAGIARLRWDGFEAGELTSREELALVDGEGRWGRVLIDRWLALNLVAATLGFAPPRALRRLGPGERGILAGHLAALLTFTGGGVVVDLAGGGAGGQVAGSSVVGLAFRVEAAGAEGPIRIEVPSAWLAGASWPAPGVAAVSKEAARLETTACLEIADTVLSRGALSGARAGDVVTFDGHAFPAESAGTAHHVRVRIGEYEVEGEVRADGAIVVLGEFRPAGKRQPPVGAAGVAPGPAVVKDGHTMAGASDDDDAKLAVLAGAPVDVVAEIGRVTLRGDEVLGLGRGSVLAFGRRGTEVDLVVGGRTWARGELVSVDGELGVRITEMLRS